MPAGEAAVSSIGWRADLSYDSPEAVAVRKDLQSSGIPGLEQLLVDPATDPAFAKTAVAQFHADGFG